MSRWYILKDKIPVLSDMIGYSMWCEENESLCFVEVTEIGNVRVSTVFLGLDHSMSFQKPGKPVLFETMIFGGKEDGYQNRYCTWDEALKGHKEACDIVLKTFSIEKEVLQKVIIEHLN